jgi:hypothetical protein
MGSISDEADNLSIFWLSPVARLSHRCFHEDYMAPSQQHAPTDQRLHANAENEASYEQNECQDRNRETNIGQKHAEKLVGYFL